MLRFLAVFVVLVALVPSFSSAQVLNRASGKEEAILVLSLPKDKTVTIEGTVRARLLEHGSWVKGTIYVDGKEKMSKELYGDGELTVRTFGMDFSFKVLARKKYTVRLRQDSIWTEVLSVSIRVLSFKRE